MIRGAEALIVICAIIWIFWMSWNWLRPKDKSKTRTKRKQ